MPAAESVMHCPSCTNAMIIATYSTFCPSCQYVIPGEGIQFDIAPAPPDPDSPNVIAPAPSTALDDLVAAADEIDFQYQPLRIPNWPSRAVIEEQWLEKLATALAAWRASTASTE
jgi:hypothetical protein